MPSTLPRPCNHIGCPATTTQGRFCDDHRRAYERNRQRPTATQRGYGSDWQRVRAEIMASHPLCRCGQPATELHHLRPLSQGGTHDTRNLQPMCGNCHRKLHGEMRTV